MKGQEKCEVPHCNHTGHSGHPCKFHFFPKDPSSCKKWVQEVGNADLLQKSLKQLNRTRWICSCHFKQSDRTSKGNLRKTAIPTEFDRALVVPLDNEAMLNFPPPDSTVTRPKPLKTLQMTSHHEFVDWNKIQSRFAKEPPIKKMRASVYEREETVTDVENISPPNAATENKL